MIVRHMYMLYENITFLCMISFRNNTKTLETPVNFNSNILKSSGCNPSDKFAIVLHGWIQSCGDDWALALIDRTF